MDIINKLNTLLEADIEFDTDDLPDADVLTQMGEFVDSLEVDDFQNSDALNEKIEQIFMSYVDFLELIDLEDLDEESLEEFFDILDSLDIDPKEIGIDDELGESTIVEWQKKFMVRKGKKIKRLPRRKGFKQKDGRYVRMSASEKRKRSRGARKGAKKAKVRLTQTLRKRRKSLKRRKSFGIKRS